MQLFLIILAVLFVLYVIGRLRSAFSVDQDAIKERLGSDYSLAKTKSSEVSRSAAAHSGSGLSRLGAKLEALSQES